MKLKRLAQIIFISGSIFSLVACSTTHKNVPEDADGGPACAPPPGSVQTSGAGVNDTFGTDGMSRDQLAAKRTYYFQYDSSAVSENEKPAIFANADNLVARPGARVLLEGHTDPRGSREYNVALGERRASAIADILKSKGVSPNQIRIISYGAQRLAVPGHSEDDYKRDRRVVLVYLQR